jgi:RNA recognition motif-containing protein
MERIQMDIYVGNLPYAATDPDLQELFEQYGKVTSARVILDRMSGRSKGFGFIEMPEQNEAQAAIDALNGSDMMGRAIRVNESQPKPRGERRGGGGGGGGGGNRW